MVLSAIVIGGRSFLGKVMECWTPHEFTNNQNAYAEEYCWVLSTYFVSPHDEQVPDELSKADRRVSYYQ